MKILCLILVMLTLISDSVGCAKKDETIAVETITENETTNISDKPNRLYPNVPEDKYDGAELKIIGTGYSYGSGYYQTKDVWVENMNGEPFNDAVYERNRNIEEKYDVVIKYNDSDNILETVTKSVQANDNTIDIVFGSWGNMAALGTGGFLYNMADSEYLNFSQPWWDQNIIGETAIAKKIFYMTGELSTMDNDCTRLVYFNKKLINDYNLDMPYDLVYKNEWTLDNFINMSKSVYSDLNGDGIPNEGDVFGLFREYGYQDFLFISCGQNYTSLDSNGKPILSFLNDKTFDLTDKIFNFLFDETACINIKNFKKTGDFSNAFAYARSLFTQDQQLFTVIGPLVIGEFRNMESDFGMAPLPKFDNLQENYRHYVDSGTNMIGIPNIVSNIDRTTILMEAMACESLYVITPVYYYTLLKRKYVRDNESEAMLDIINSSRVYVLSLVYDFGGIRNVLSKAYDNGKLPHLSDYEKISGKAEANINKIFNMYLAIN